METILATDEVIDAIAEIEVQRQAMELEGGAAAASSSALRRLHALLDDARQALQSHGPDAGYPANVDTVTMEIERVKQLAPITNPGSLSRNMGRRTMERAGGR